MGLSEFQLGLIGFPALLLLIFLRVPIAAALFIVGLVGTYIVEGNTRLMDSQLKTFTYGQFTNYSLSIIPLFLLMSEFATRGGMSKNLFAAANAWLGHHRGGLAMAAVGASAGFGAVCGSSLATASSMGKVALPELDRAGYSGALSTGALAAWDAGHFNPAFCGVGRLLDPRRAKYRKTVHRSLHTRPHCDAGVHDHNRDLCAGLTRCCITRTACSVS